MSEARREYGKGREAFEQIMEQEFSKDADMRSLLQELDKSKNSDLLFNRTQDITNVVRKMLGRHSPSDVASKFMMGKYSESDVEYHAIMLKKELQNNGVVYGMTLQAVNAPHLILANGEVIDFAEAGLAVYGRYIGVGLADFPVSAAQQRLLEDENAEYLEGDPDWCFVMENVRLVDLQGEVVAEFSECDSHIAFGGGEVDFYRHISDEQ